MDLRNHFLLSMPALEDPNFSRTLTLVCDHSEHGAMGLVINRPVAVTCGEILAHLGIDAATEHLTQQPVYYGGPVEPERGFVIHEPVGQWDGTLRIDDHLGVTTSRDILDAIARGAGPARFLLALGYSGWGAGQLEAELTQNAWLTCPASRDILFDLPAEDRLSAAAQHLGIDLDLLSSDAGHA